jgi:hypothetical protein
MAFEFIFNTLEGICQLGVRGDFENPAPCKKIDIFW